MRFFRAQASTGQGVPKIRFWANYQRALCNTASTAQFKTEQYFALIRNFRRYVPLFVYLFGASPALCRSFIKDQQHQLEEGARRRCELEP